MTTATTVLLIVSVIIPLLSSLLSRAHWPSEVTGILTLVLSTANGFFVEWSNAGDNFHWKQAVLNSVVSFFVAIASRYGLWKATTTDAVLLRSPRAKPTPAKRAA
jgi:hypothetical protein